MTPYKVGMVFIGGCILAEEGPSRWHCRKCRADFAVAPEAAEVD